MTVQTGISPADFDKLLSRVSLVRTRLGPTNYGNSLLVKMSEETKEGIRIDILSTEKRELARKQKQLANVPPWIIANNIREMCSRSPKQRDVGDLLDLCAMTSVLCKFFLHQPLDTLRNLCKTVMYEEVRKNTILFRQGEPVADKFYVILSGTICILVENGGKNQKLATFGRGQAFGDVAILCGQARAATVVTETLCEFLTLDRHTLLQHFEAGGSLYTRSPDFLLKRCKALQNVALSTVKKFARHLSVVHFPREYQFNLDSGTKAYFLKEGVCTVIKPGGASPATVDTGPSPRVSMELAKENSNSQAMQPGSFFGESCVFEERRRGLCVKAQTNVMLYQFPAAVLQDPQYSAVATALLKEYEYEPVEPGEVSRSQSDHPCEQSASSEDPTPNVPIPPAPKKPEAGDFTFHKSQRVKHVQMLHWQGNQDGAISYERTEMLSKYPQECADLTLRASKMVPVIARKEKHEEMVFPDRPLTAPSSLNRTVRSDGCLWVTLLSMLPFFWGVCGGPDPPLPTLLIHRGVPWLLSGS
ncbi:hypothetical protein CYMTET_20065 [Cymbomonas tetramitiformis]|uniref:Cyclic nucleotide-binding domain-containing protein n=1 Tax=Cymbomonas tetramitiformis TaxID=36881 RepID=A0AAE0G4U0_9CHLO|nr:hypothetical protein CYMTET_20065 [Cymbomonas tetramitiformis]